MLNFIMSAKDTGKTFRDLTALTYPLQSQYFLNSFYDEFKDKMEEVYGHYKLFITFDEKNGNKGTQLDEFAALQFFEKSGESMSRDEFRTKLKEVDVGSDGKMAFLEYVMYKYGKTGEEMLNALPGARNDEWFDAKKEFDDIQSEFDARAKKLKDLEAAVDAGGVKGASAKSELEQFKLTDMTDEQKKKLIQATARFKKAEEVGPVKDKPAEAWWVERCKKD